MSKKMVKIGKDERIEQAEALLQGIKEMSKVLEETKIEADEEIKAVKEKWTAKVQAVKRALSETEEKLEKLLRKHRGFFFADGDYRQLEGGAVYVRIVKAVKKARGVTVELLKALGYTDGVKVEESVNWSEIEKWTDEKLTAIGTERVEKEEFGYDLA